MKWIDIKDVDPDFQEHCIVNTNGGVTTGKLIRIDSHGRHWQFNESNQIYWGSKKVTHWMPLPEPPNHPQP